MPIVGGHEGAGVVEEVGEGVTRLKVGDHIVCSFLPVCGHCRWCSTGRSNLCDLGATILDGCLLDGTYRFHTSDGEDVGGMCMLGTFSEYATVSELSSVKVDDDLPLDKVALIGCGVPTGWGSAVHAAQVEPGDTILIYGIGGIGINSVQGAALAGARNVVAVDPVAFKREQAEQLGATHSFATAGEAALLIHGLTRGVMADKAIITAGTRHHRGRHRRVQHHPQGRNGRGHRPRRSGVEQHPDQQLDADADGEADPGQPVRLGRPVPRHPADGEPLPGPATSSWTS